MRVLYQPTQDTPGDWLECDSSDWVSVVSESFSLHALCVQGVIFEGPDHYSIRDVSPGVTEVIVWHDDPTDWPQGMRWARKVTFRHLAPDLAMGGAINTHQTQIIYAEAGLMPIFRAAHMGDPKVKLRLWAQLDKTLLPALSGIWVADELHETHQAVRSIQGWREWTEGLDSLELDVNGRLKSQLAQGRWVKPAGTQTFYHNLNDLANNAYSAEYENALGLTATGAGTETFDSIKDQGTLVWVATSPVGRPGETAWPTTGAYRYQIDCTAVGADCSFGLLTQGSEVGEFARVSGDTSTRLQGIAQDQSAFTGSGWHVASITDPAWTSGDSSDRFVVAVAAIRTAGHVAQSITLQLGEADDYADGSWPEYVVRNAPFFGANF